MTDGRSPAAGGHSEPREVRVSESHGSGHGASASPADPGDAHHSHDGSSGHDAHDEALGPVDVQAWAVGVLGVVIGLVVAVCFAMSTGYLFT